MDRYAQEATRLQQEQAAYLAKVQAGRSVRRVDPFQPSLSQPMDDVRQAKGLGAQAYTEAKRRIADLLAERR